MTPWKLKKFDKTSPGYEVDLSLDLEKKSLPSAFERKTKRFLKKECIFYLCDWLGKNPDEILEWFGKYV